MTSPLLTLTTVESYYFDRLWVIKGVSLSLPERAIHAIIGPNGAGKTTLLRTIMGLIRDQPKKGEIFFRNIPIHRKDPEEITRLGVHFLPDTGVVFRELTVEENLALAFYPHRKKEEELKEVFSLFPFLKERRKQKAGELSGGEQKIVALAFSFLKKPSLLLLDEPTVGLAPQIRKIFMTRLRSFLEKGCSILFTEQNVSLTFLTADYVYILEGGKIVHKGTPQELKEDSRVQELYLGRGIQEEGRWKIYKRKRRW